MSHKNHYLVKLINDMEILFIYVYNQAESLYKLVMNKTHKECLESFSWRKESFIPRTEISFTNNGKDYGSDKAQSVSYLSTPLAIGAT